MSLPSGRGAILKVEYHGEEKQHEIKKLLDAVKENEDDYERWKDLISAATTLEDGVHRNSSPSAIDLVRNVFDCMLAKFPLFFGFWKQYADLEFAIGGTETAEMVFERGVSCVPTSLDLWVHYLEFKNRTCHNNNVIREMFERAAYFVGADYFSAQLFWDKYIEFEQSLGESARVVKICTRALQIPMYHTARYYEKLGGVINTNVPVEQLADSEVLETLQNQMIAENQGQPDKGPLENERYLRNKIHTYYYDLYSQISPQVQPIHTFETDTKRQYFLVEEVPQAELEAWRKYLEYAEGSCSFERASSVYERCLVPCALYEEFWLRYARWMFSQGKEENARIIYMRASSIFVPIEDPTVRLNWARFEEKLGRTSVAKDIYIAILDESPDHEETLLALTNLERRHEGNDAAVQLLEEYIAKSSTQTGGMLAAEQARILWQSKGDVEGARQVFTLKKDQFADSREFWHKFLEFEIAQPSTDQEEAHMRVKNVHNQLCAHPRLSAEAKKELSSVYMKFLLNRGGKDAAKEYIELDKEINGPKVDSAKPSPLPLSAPRTRY